MNSLLVLLGAVGGGAITAFITTWATRKRTSAEVTNLDAQAADIIVRAASQLVQKSDELAVKNEKKLEAKIAELEAKVDVLTRAVVDLSAQLRAAGITPVVSKPPNWE
jgi:predicted kinase